MKSGHDTVILSEDAKGSPYGGQQWTKEVVREVSLWKVAPRSPLLPIKEWPEVLGLSEQEEEA